MVYPTVVRFFMAIFVRAARNANTVEKTADRLKPVAQEDHRLKSVLRVLGGFSSRAREAGGGV